VDRGWGWRVRWGKGGGIVVVWMMVVTYWILEVRFSYELEWGYDTTFPFWFFVWRFVMVYKVCTCVSVLHKRGMKYRAEVS
jgi:hypothetical protein